MRGVRAVFNQFIFEHDAEDKAQSEVEKELCTILKLRYKNDAPRRPPRIIIQGPPGSGRTQQCESVAAQFGLVKVSVRDLLKNELRENPDNGKEISRCIDNGETIADNIINSLVETRLKQSDCKVNGWVLEGFPESES